ncbi:hypothetical protein FRB91_009604 [Serendipita sp. 411]|nr:hypothetical protein FRB91_009604 [Serendipita sp. 411]
MGQSCAADVHIDSIRYVFDSSLFGCREDIPLLQTCVAGDAESAALVRFGRVAWNRISIDFLEPDPKPHILLKRGEIGLYAPSITYQMDKFASQPEPGAVKDVTPLAKLHLEYAHVHARSITDIPISTAHPYLLQLKEWSPRLSNIVFPGIFTSSFVTPPHLSIIPSSSLFPTLFTSLEAFKLHSKNRNDVPHIYSIPLPDPSLNALIIVGAQGTSKMTHVSVALEHTKEAGNTSHSISLLGIREMEIRGRNGERGGLYSLHLRNISHSLEEEGEPNTESLGGFISIVDAVWSIITQPLYLASFAYSARPFVSRKEEFELYKLKSLFQYRIDTLEIADETPITSMAGSIVGAACDAAIRWWQGRFGAMY